MDNKHIKLSLNGTHDRFMHLHPPKTNRITEIPRNGNGAFGNLARGNQNGSEPHSPPDTIRPGKSHSAYGTSETVAAVLMVHTEQHYRMIGCLENLLDEIRAIRKYMDVPLYMHEAATAAATPTATAPNTPTDTREFLKTATDALPDPGWLSDLLSEKAPKASS